MAIRSALKQSTEGGLEWRLISVSSSVLEGALNTMEGRTDDRLIYLVSHSLFTRWIISSVRFCLSNPSHCTFLLYALTHTVNGLLSALITTQNALFAELGPL